jgi:hypothetical protein
MRGSASADRTPPPRRFPSTPTRGRRPPGRSKRPRVPSRGPGCRAAAARCRRGGGSGSCRCRSPASRLPSATSGSSPGSRSSGSSIRVAAFQEAGCRSDPGSALRRGNAGALPVRSSPRTGAPSCSGASFAPSACGPVALPPAGAGVPRPGSSAGSLQPLAGRVARRGLRRRIRRLPRGPPAVHAAVPRSGRGGARPGRATPGGTRWRATRGPGPGARG